ncbi:MAG TPA: response regulator transcription factor, partial [Chitinophagaceae bacterium]|nr:response regulator transcription factor [Chitinophagaceae bacterium]
MNKAGKILLADDEPDILEIVSYNLIAEGYEVICAKNGNQAIELAKQYLPSMIILDVMMPGKNGIEVCRILRSEPMFKETVIIFLSALGDERSEIRGLETGADDYITKPISPKVLTSKVNALFRRVSKDESPVLHLGDLLINREKYNVTYKDSPVTLARKEFELLSLLASKPGKVF